MQSQKKFQELKSKAGDLFKEYLPAQNNNDIMHGERSEEAPKTTEVFANLLNTGGLTGVPKKITQIILNKYSKILADYSFDNLKSGLETLIEKAARQITSAVAKKIALVLTVILVILAVIVTIITLIAGGSVIVPLIVFGVLIALSWIATNAIAKRAARKIAITTTGVLYTALVTTYEHMLSEKNEEKH